MTTNYQQEKGNVMEQYDLFCKFVSKIKNGKAVTYENSLEQLAKDAEDIKNDSFRLMVVGEAKSGKSTFINAYLGKDILPMDITQCTSSIVEIRYGEKYLLTATYADDSIRLIEGEEDIKQFLRDNATLSDDFRKIPVDAINIHLIVPNCGKKPSEGDVQEFIKQSLESNIEKLPSVEYAQKIREYIVQKLPDWKTIVKKLVIEYPFEDEDLRGIQIVDSPGVNVAGRVDEITSNYIANAHAVMFCKPVIAGALEDSSFKKFLETTSADRNADAMFLVLTRAADAQKEDIDKQMARAYKQYPNINPKQILCLDSVVELFRKSIIGMTEENLCDFMDKQMESESLRPSVAIQWSYSQRNRDTYLQRLSRLSNFGKMEEALNLFARKAHYMLLERFLDRMGNVLNKIDAEKNEEIKLRKTQTQTPEKLSEELYEKREEIARIQFALNESLRKISSEYSGMDGVIAHETTESFSSFRKELDELNPHRADSVDMMEKYTFRQVERMMQLQNRIRDNVIKRCDTELRLCCEMGALDYKIIQPDITPESLEKTKSESRCKAEEYTTGGCFKKAKKTFDQSKYFDIIKNDIVRKLDSYKDDVKLALLNYVDDITSVFQKELEKNLGVTQKRYDEIEAEKKSAEEIYAVIAEMERDVEYIASLQIKIKELKGGMH